MHAVYSFLITASEPCRRISDEGILEIAADAFEDYADRYCDDNNWHGKICVITQDQRIAHYHERSIGHWFELEIDKFEAARRWSVSLLCRDAEFLEPALRWRHPRDYADWQSYLLSKTANLRADVLMMALHEDLRVRLAGDYSRISLRDYDNQENFSDNFDRRERSRILERLRRTLSHPERRPFDYPSTPYDSYRAMSLVSDHPLTGDNAMILMVDIHT